MTGVSNYAIVAILCLQTLINCLNSTIGQYIYGFYLSTYPNLTNNTYDFFIKIDNNTNQCIENNNSSNGNAELWAQQQSANLFFRINLTSSCPVIIMTYLLGLYTSKLGKRLVILIPMIGGTSQLIIWLAIIYFHLPDYCWYIAAFLVGLSGSTGVLGLTLNLIIIENTLESERSSRFVRLNAMQTALSALTTLAIGYYIIWRGFMDLYWLALGLQILSIIIVLIFFKSNENFFNHEQTPLLSSAVVQDEVSEIPSISCQEFFRVFTVYRSNNRSRQKSSSLYLTLFANIFYMLSITGYAPFLWILLNTPFCWKSKDIGNYLALSAISSSILSLIGMQLLVHIGTNDAIICLISHICSCLTCLWIAFAQYSWQLYVGLLVSGFSGYQGSLTTSMMSKWLEIHERNYAFTLVTETNTIIATFGSSFFNWIYALTVEKYRTFTIFIAAGLGVVPLILNLCLYIITRKMSDEEQVSSTEPDIEPAVLHLQNTCLAYNTVPDCIIVPSRSLTTSVRTPTSQRSRSNSIIDNEREEITGSPSYNRALL